MLILPFRINAQDSLAVRPTWSINFQSIFDNSEGDRTYTPSQTHFLGNLDLTGGLKFGPEGRHMIAAGIAATVPYGCEWDSTRISPTLYYRFHKSGLRFDMGMLPHRDLVEEVPTYILSDSARYWQHNIRGAMVAITRPQGYFQAYIDWRGLQSAKRREAFDIVASGQWQPRKNIFTLGGTAMLNHLAKRNPSPEGEYIVDNILAQAYAGINLSHRYTWADSLSAYAGPIIALNRYRANDKWISSKGIYTTLAYCYRWFAASNTFTYTGTPLYPLYRQFGCSLYEGEPYYASRYYNRTELSARLLRLGSAMTLRASAIFNLAENCFQYSQRLTLTVSL